MPSISEVGHAKNVANFEQLLTICKSYGSQFNPSKSDIQFSNTENYLLLAKEAVLNVNKALPVYSFAVTERENAFKPLSKLVTRIFNAYSASGANGKNIENIKSICKKIKGARISGKSANNIQGGTPSEIESTRKISVSQMSYHNRIDNLDKLIQILKNEPYYKPNEEDLKIATLEKLLVDLKKKSNAVTESSIPLNNARLERNKLLYDASNGLIQKVKNIKMYVKSVFGATDNQYKQISGIKFFSKKI